MIRQHLPTLGVPRLSWPGTPGGVRLPLSAGRQVQSRPGQCLPLGLLQMLTALQEVCTALLPEDTLCATPLTSVYRGR